MIDRRDPLFNFILAVLGLHIVFVLGWVTIAVLSQ